MDTLFEFFASLTGDEWGVLAAIFFALLAVGLICWGVIGVRVWMVDP